MTPLYKSRQKKNLSPFPCRDSLQQPLQSLSDMIIVITSTARRAKERRLMI